MTKRLDHENVPDGWLVRSERAGHVGVEDYESGADRLIEKMQKEWGDAYGEFTKHPLFLKSEKPWEKFDNDLEGNAAPVTDQKILEQISTALLNRHRIPAALKIAEDILDGDLPNIWQYTDDMHPALQDEIGALADSVTKLVAILKD